MLDRLERIMVPATGAQSVILGMLSRMQVQTGLHVLMHQDPCRSPLSIATSLGSVLN